MNQTVELVRLWGEYEKANTHPTLEGFCRSHLAGEIKKEKIPKPQWEMHPDLNGALLKTISRIGKIQEVYVNKALHDSALDQIEEFGILSAIFNLKNPIKSEAIFTNMLELSSGTNILIRLKNKKLISEFADSEDKRVRRLKLTANGEKVFRQTKQQILKVVAMLAQELSDDDKQLCLHILKPIDHRFSPLIQKQKNKSFNDVFKENYKL